jgi:hypothetical protein
VKSRFPAFLDFAVHFCSHSRDQQREQPVVKVTGANGEGQGRAADADPPSRWRPPAAEFLPSFVALQDAVSRACARQGEWQAKIAAGIRAALEFAVTDPAGAHALTIDARRQRLDEGDREQEVIGYFASLLVRVAPAERRFPISTDEGTIESIAIMVRGHLIAGTTEQLSELAPELIYLALMPYTGLAEARQWTESPASVGVEGM